VQRAPVIYQEEEGVRRQIAGAYVVEGSSTVRFHLDTYDPNTALVIDPVLVFSTYPGGSSLDRIYDMAVDESGNVLVTGQTGSTDFPTANPVYGTFNGEFADMFVSKISADGSTLVFSTYSGGTDNDTGEGIALDNVGGIYVAGTTRSLDFPMEPSFLICALKPELCSFQRTHGGGTFDAVLVKLNYLGSGISWSTYLGGSGDDQALEIVMDHLGAGFAHVVGDTNSSDFPTPGAFQGSGANDAFVTKLSSSATSLIYSTRLGGYSSESGFAIAVDEQGAAHVTGQTKSSDFPTHDAVQPEYGGGPSDGFVTKLNPDGSALEFSSFLGGSWNESNFDATIALDSRGGVYVAGTTLQSDFPTVAALQPEFNGVEDGFVVKLGKGSLNFWIASAISSDAPGIESSGSAADQPLSRQ
jgi:hypothetical protein